MEIYAAQRYDMQYGMQQSIDAACLSNINTPVEETPSIECICCRDGEYSTASSDTEMPLRVSTIARCWIFQARMS